VQAAKSLNSPRRLAHGDEMPFPSKRVKAGLQTPEEVARNPFLKYGGFIHGEGHWSVASPCALPLGVGFSPWFVGNLENRGVENSHCEAV